MLFKWRTRVFPLMNYRSLWYFSRNFFVCWESFEVILIEGKQYFSLDNFYILCHWYIFHWMNVLCRMSLCNKVCYVLFLIANMIQFIVTAVHFQCALFHHSHCFSNLLMKSTNAPKCCCGCPLLGRSTLYLLNLGQKSSLDSFSR